jgi:tRNA modification GTPase
MPAPHSYTREDVVELHLPGAEPLVRDAIERCLRAGARAAEPGEFTRRAFLNGRLDLAQAEAVQALIAARSQDEVRAAAGLLRGEFSREVRAVEEAALALCAAVEAALDFVDQDIEIVAPAEARARAEEIRLRLERLLAETAARRVAGAAPTAFLYGAPNAGKSSLFNRLTGADAIVSPVPGTTRDLLVAECAGVRLVDAPGMFEAEGADAEAVARARAEAEHADVWIVVMDATEPMAPDVRRPAIRVVNKCDLRRNLPMREALFTSAVTGEGIDALRHKLAEFARGEGAGAAGARFSVSVRQRELLEGARAAFGRAAAALGGGLGMEFVALDLRGGLEALGAVTGRSINDDLLQRIFEKFCVGK